MGEMTSAGDIWAVLPIKETGFAKQRLAQQFSQDFRRRLALTMFEDIVRAVAGVSELSGIAVVTLDPAAAAIALRFGAQIWTDAAREGHTGAVAAAARRLAANGAGMLTLPWDIPLVSSADVRRVLQAHGSGRAFTIVPARDKQGSNTILCSPADAVPLRFGANSFFPHLDTARQCGLEPTVVECPAIALDLDEPQDIAEFMNVRSATATRRLLERELARAPAELESLAS
jgi:2-phospho-L-lactate/phosphoenolpyruvate guanylyltransferase